MKILTNKSLQSMDHWIEIANFDRMTEYLSFFLFFFKKQTFDKKLICVRKIQMTPLTKNSTMQ